MAGDSIATTPVDGGRIAYHRSGSGRPLLVLNGLAATSADWDPSFIERLASANELILLDNRGIGASTDNGAPFEIDELADDAARVIEGLGFERVSVWGGRWADSSPRPLLCNIRPASTNSSCFPPTPEALMRTRIPRCPIATNRHIWHTA
jgi:hypothetical protein